MSLEELRTAVIDSVVGADIGVTEGNVLSGVSVMPYRRLDLRHRAFAYLRVRERTGVVRIDVTGFFGIPESVRTSDLAAPSMAAGLSVMVRNGGEAQRAVVLLRRIVEANVEGEAA